MMELRHPIDPSKPVNARGWRMDGMIKEEYRLRLNYPARQAVRYNQAELEQMLAAYDAGCSIEEIARDHQRSVGGVGGRLEELVERRRNGWPLCRGAENSPEQREACLQAAIKQAQSRVYDMRKSLCEAENLLRELLNRQTMDRRDR